MDNLNMHTPDLTAQNIDRIAELFPSAITEMRTPDGKLKKGVNFDLLKQLLSPDVVDGDERYEFTWVGKKAAMAEAARPTTRTLRPVKGDSRDWDTTQNLYIEGDNLEVLKILQESYLGKVKMIYIDPPYNTGHDFIYRDDFAMSGEEWSEKSGEKNEEGERLFENTESNGRFHSDWCSMMYSRLALARNMLTEDGVIFVSIDDTEVGNLRKICDETFGDSNFLANLIWEKKYTVANDALFFSDNHDHILCYAKNISTFTIGKLPRTDEMNAAYKNPDNHPKGPWKATPLHAKSGSAKSAEFSYTFENGVTFTPPAGTYSRYSKETLKNLDENNEIWFGKDGTSIPSRKTFLCDLKNSGIVPRTIIPFSVGGHNHEAVEELRQLLKDNVFTNPKPVRLLRYLLTVANCRQDSIILDFFSGSATTAHAVMQLNAEDGGRRKFIMVQLPEPCDEKSEAYKAGYKNICEIGKERIRRAGDKIQAEHPDPKMDIGFRVFRVDESNMKDVYYHPEEVEQTEMGKMVSNIKEDRTDLDLLYACLLDWGVEIGLPHTTAQIAGCTVHNVDSGALVACFDAAVPGEVVEYMAKLQPLRAVFRDSSFATDADKINVTEIFKNLSPDTKVKVI